LTSFIIEHQCPQCGAPAELEETDRLFHCGFCRVRSFLSVADVFRYVLPDKAPAGKDLIYFPYWRFKGMLFACLPGSIKNRFVDISQQAIPSAHFPFSMGFRTQTQALRFATADHKGIFLTPRITKAALLKHLNEQFSANMRKPILHQAHIGETISLLYAPFYLGKTLMDGVINSPVENSTADTIEPLLQEREAPKWPIHFLSTLCPQCGWDLDGEKEALTLCCSNCQSVWSAGRGAFERLDVAHVPDGRGATVYLPFWRIQADIGGMELKSYADLIRVAVELNERLVPRKNFAATPLHDGDRLEIVTFVGGG